VDKKHYAIFNFLILSVCLFIMVYAYFFANNGSGVSCIYQKYLGKPCITCGTTRSFQLILKGQFNKAYTLNSYGVWLFVFFASQIIFRIIALINPYKKISFKKWLWVDVAFTIVLFLLSFGKLIINQL
jgi:hypothetical protein